VQSGTSQMIMFKNQIVLKKLRNNQTGLKVLGLADMTLTIMLIVIIMKINTRTKCGMVSVNHCGHDPYVVTHVRNLRVGHCAIKITLLTRPLADSTTHLKEIKSKWKILVHIIKKSITMLTYDKDTCLYIVEE